MKNRLLFTSLLALVSLFFLASATVKRGETTYYEGSASVKVYVYQDEKVGCNKGKTRKVYVTIPCSSKYKSKTELKEALRKRLKFDMSSCEEMTSDVEYEIEVCQ